MQYFDSIVTVLGLLVTVGSLAVMMQRGNLRLEKRLKADILGLDGKIDTVRTELKTDIDTVRTELKTDINAMRTELKTDINTIRTELKADLVRLDDRVFVLAARLAPSLEEEKPEPVARGVRKA